MTFLISDDEPGCERLFRKTHFGGSMYLKVFADLILIFFPLKKLLTFDVAKSKE